MNNTQSERIPLLEFDPTRDAIIEPSKVFRRRLNMPDACLLCFFQAVIDQLEETGRIKKICNIQSMVHTSWPIFKLEQNGRKIAIANPGLGGPHATMTLEYLVASGCSKFLAVGVGGTLDPKLRVGQLVAIEAAIRDEGTSYHYLPPAREVQANPHVLEHITSELTKRNVNFITAKTWTTDAYCRETPEKIAWRAREGAKTVEMEASSLMAVAQFRGVPLAYLIYCGDDVSGKIWNERAAVDRPPLREQLFWLGVELCLALLDA